MSISKITTANTGKEGLLKINEVIDKSITGVTYSSGILGIRTQDGTQYTATLPQMPNGIISGGQVTVDGLNALVYDVTAVVYNCAGNSYSVSAPPALIITLNPGDITDPRIDFIVGNTSNSLEVIEGTPGTPTVEPFLPSDKTLIGKITVAAGATSTGGTTNEPIDLAAYLPLAGGTMTGSIDMQTTNTINWGASRLIGWQDGPFILDGLLIANMGDGTYAPSQLFLGDSGIVGANLTAKRVYIGAGVADGGGDIELQSDGFLQWSNPNTGSLQFRLEYDEAFIKTANSSASGVVWTNFIVDESDGAYFLSNMTVSDQLGYLGINTGTFPITPITTSTPGAGSVVMYSQRNLWLIADYGETINIEAGSLNETYSAAKQTSASEINETYTYRTENINGVNRTTLGWNLTNTTGNTATYSEVIVPIADLADGVYKAHITGSWVVKLTSGDVYQEYVSYDAVASFHIVGGSFDYLDNGSYNQVLGEGVGNMSINGFTAGLAIDFTSMIVYDNTYTTTHNAVIELIYMP